MGSGNPTHEHCAIFEMNSWLTIHMIDWENCAIF